MLARWAKQAEEYEARRLRQQKGIEPIERREVVVVPRLPAEAMPPPETEVLEDPPAASRGPGGFAGIQELFQREAN
jgi:hypothetical protein